jgi:hypothetical protein
MVGKRTVYEEDYVDVAGGYDETDPFVDNSEAVSGTPSGDVLYNYNYNVEFAILLSAR